jgi:hypothetical protein
VKPNIRIARGQPTTVDIHVIHLPRGIKTPLPFDTAIDDYNSALRFEPKLVGDAFKRYGVQ